MAPFSTDYFELWSLGLEYASDPLEQATEEWERQATRIVERYAVEADQMAEAPRFLQSNERLFWDRVYEGR